MKFWTNLIHREAFIYILSLLQAGTHVRKKVFGGGHCGLEPRGSGCFLSSALADEKLPGMLADVKPRTVARQVRALGCCFRIFIFLDQQFVPLDLFFFFFFFYPSRKKINLLLRSRCLSRRAFAKNVKIIRRQLSWRVGVKRLFKSGFRN